MIPDYNQYVGLFRDYVNSVGSHDDFIQEHLDLKVHHTFRVADNIRRICMDSAFPDEQTELARLIALFHDIGRFEQFIKFRTFDDNKSLNHAGLGVQIIKSNGFLKDLTDEKRDIVYGAIMNHNVSMLDPALDKKILHYARLIRDADKVDIWYILTLRDVVNVILTKDHTEESYSVPRHITDSFRHGRVVPSATSMNDYRLLRLSWIYDMNFPATFSLILKRDYLPKILAKIPPSAEKQEISEIIYRFVNEKAEMQNNTSRLVK